MNIGFIGTGNMGRILIESFIESNAANPSDITITNRTRPKAESLQKSYPSLHVASNASEVIHKSNIIFLCVKPLDIHPLLEKVRPLLKPHHCLISITSPISVKQLEELVDCQVARIIPSITNRAFSGVSLVTYGESCKQHYRLFLDHLLSKISIPLSIENNITRVSSDIVSCGPAFFSYLLQRFIDSAVEETEITKDQATKMISEMVVGFGKLLETNLYTLPTLQEKVCVKGGVTGEGIKVLEEHVGEMFNKVFQQTHAKYDEDLEKVGYQFNK
ncbi:late competence protein ComER [Priestia filamentosa]|uniref:Pyrroline-5-carboxylate reductase n=1 Tax=Priestia filamentosa TaxID=1402861 RepID=A0A1X7CWF4_9BACI|nr:late competence protein ComER [Priestia filamentosa]AKO94210.1 late competence protein ComER [Priestia filamentosa]MDT3764481.1 late competence protein ComER [Priestia filamentosa]OXS71064.1 late competence protein ComER [Priestia filamentosa]WRU94834.1 late competence protein ComER [Priestia filamentosa]SMF04310.1 competence protein ComER [Priestia filamentosa]